jgi:hypothetical protein
MKLAIVSRHLRLLPDAERHAKKGAWITKRPSLGHLRASGSERFSNDAKQPKNEQEEDYASKADADIHGRTPSAL